MDDTIDTLQIKIDQAKAKLPAVTLNAINAVEWRASILSLREKLGYTFEQLGDLEIETELVLCGLLTTENYPKELKNRMKVSDAQANELVNEMNVLVFSRIKEEMIKTTENKKIFGEKVETIPIKINVTKPEPIQEVRKIPIVSVPVQSAPAPESETQKKANADLFGSHGIEIIEKKTPAPIFASKLSGSFQIPTVKTEHTLENITKTSATPTPEIDMKPKIPKTDPYREIPE